MSEFLQLGRRDLLRHILVLAGASVTSNFSLEALADAARKPERLLSKQAFDTLSAVTDTIIPVTDTPGALAADVPARFDALLSNWAAPATRDMIVATLGDIDNAARKAKGKGFTQLSAEERQAVLIDYDKAALQPGPPPTTPPKTMVFARLKPVVNSGYQRLKHLTITLYYVSEVGMTQELVYEHVPGAWVPSLKITPGMRPFADPKNY